MNRPVLWLAHPAQQSAVYLAVPVLVNLLALWQLPQVALGMPLLVVQTEGLLVAISWSPVGLAICALLGGLLGLPLALLQATIWHVRLRQVRQGADPERTLAHHLWATGAAPWVLLAVVGFLLGRPWLFPPLGGVLLAVNVLWARALVYPAHRLAWEYLRADEELRAEEEAA